MFISSPVYSGHKVTHNNYSILNMCHLLFLAFADLNGIQSVTHILSIA